MNSPKKEEVRQMFDNISGHYDFLNHFLSLGIDKGWRRRVIKIINDYHLSTKNYELSTILDIATGTADLAIEAASLKAHKIIGIDISNELLKIGQYKIAKRGLNSLIQLIEADGENIPFPDNHFDAETIAFGIRNFEDPLKGLKEMYRVLNNNGILAVLEFSKPTVFPVNFIYWFYFRGILPVIGRLISKSKNAYTYLPDSVYSFPHGKEFLKLMNAAGFSNSRQIKLSFGIASIYLGEKH
jgi:demethylmenaquinone methyltransferase / 2-methoxy-6-polyprenyl-1,4-benzoquinol methylase